MRWFYDWQAMAVDVAGFGKGCHPCARNRLPERTRAKRLRFLLTSAPNEHVAIDLLRPFPRKADRNIFLLDISDRFTNLSRTVAFLDDKALTVVAAFINHWVSEYGIPAKLLSENGCNTTPTFVASVLVLLGMELFRTSDYHPQTNGLVERQNLTLVKMLKCYVADHKNTWDRLF